MRIMTRRLIWWRAACRKLARMLWDAAIRGRVITVSCLLRYRFPFWLRTSQSHAHRIYGVLMFLKYSVVLAATCQEMVSAFPQGCQANILCCAIYSRIAAWRRLYRSANCLLVFVSHIPC